MAADIEVWTFDRTDRVGGHATKVEGNPTVVETAVGRAVEFDGVDDALLLDVHPLEGARAFTWEAIFRPDGGAEAQRWFHLQESATDNRLLFELRVLNGKWYFDSYLHSGENRKALIDRSKVHPLLAWYHVAAVYDGREFRNYVNGVQEGAAEIRFDPPGPGRSAIGVRINRVNYFKGAIRAARFTRRALAPGEFMKREGAWKEVSFPTADGGIVYGDLYGSGRRGVVLAHGGRFDKASWGDQAYALMNAGFRVLAIDLRGYGQSRGPGHSDVFSAPLHQDVLAGIRYLRTSGAQTVSLVGASLGGGAVGDAVLDPAAGEIDRIVFLAASPAGSLQKLKARTLFIVARDDANDAGPRLPAIRAAYETAPDPRKLLILEGDAHAQFLFATDQRARVLREIVRFLSEP
jgi:pimeloyl-ACP methyl ester carboxylesterase